MRDERSIEERADECTDGEGRDIAQTRLQAVSVDDLMRAELKAPTFAIEPLVPYGVATLFAAHGGAGKSMLALTVAAHFACGREWAGFKTGHGPTVFVSLEDSGDIVRYRLKRIVDTYCLGVEAIARNLRVFDGSASDAALVSEVALDGVRTIARTATWEELIKIVAGAKLIIVDNASDAFDGDENNRRQVRGFMRMLAGIAKEHDAGLVLLAHIDKAAARNGSQGNSYSGSTAWHNTARSRIALVEHDKQLELRHEKSNYSQLAKPIALQWNAYTGVLIPDASDAASQEDGSVQDDADVLAAIVAAIALGVNVTTARSGPLTTFTAIKTLAEFPRWATAGGGKVRFWEAINRLYRAKIIESADYMNDQRKTKTRYEVRQSFAPHIPHTPSAGTGATGAVPSAECDSCSDSRTGATGATGAADEYRAAKDGGL